MIDNVLPKRLFSSFQDAHFSIVRCRVACRCWTAPYDGENPSPDTVVSDSDLISLASSLSSINLDGNPNSKKSDAMPSNPKVSIHLGKNVTASNDSGIHEDGLDSNSQTDLIPSVTKLNTDDFQLPSWLANGEPIPEELLAKRLCNSQTTHRTGDEDEEDEEFDPYKPSSFYGFSFVDLSGSSEDTWSVRSSNGPSLIATAIRDEIKTCVETLNSCLNHFRQMNEEFEQNQNEIEEEMEIDDDVREVIDHLLDQIETMPNESAVTPSLTISIYPPISLDSTLLNELLTKKLNLHEYLVLLDRLVDNNIIQLSEKSAEDLSNEIVSLADEIEHYRTMINNENYDDVDPKFLHRNFESQYHQQYLSNTQSNYSVLSFLQQSTSMDMSLLMINDSTNPNIQSTLITSTIQQQQQQTSTNGGKLADIGVFHSHRTLNTGIFCRF